MCPGIGRWVLRNTGPPGKPYLISSWMEPFFSPWQFIYLQALAQWISLRYICWDSCWAKDAMVTVARGKQTEVHSAGFGEGCRFQAGHPWEPFSRSRLGRSCSTRAASLSGLCYPPFVPTPAPVVSDWPFPALLPGTTGWPTDETSLWGTSEPCWPLSLMDRAVALPSFPVHPGPSSRPGPLLSKALMSQFSFPRLCVCPFWLKTFHRTSNPRAFVLLLCHKESSLLLLCPIAACLSNFLFPNEA